MKLIILGGQSARRDGKITVKLVYSDTHSFATTIFCDASECTTDINDETIEASQFEVLDHHPHIGLRKQLQLLAQVGPMVEEFHVPEDKCQVTVESAIQKVGAELNPDSNMFEVDARNLVENYLQSLGYKLGLGIPADVHSEGDF